MEAKTITLTTSERKDVSKEITLPYFFKPDNQINEVGRIYSCGGKNFIVKAWHDGDSINYYHSELRPYNTPDPKHTEITQAEYEDAIDIIAQKLVRTI